MERSVNVVALRALAAHLNHHVGVGVGVLVLVLVLVLHLILRPRCAGEVCM
jgi:hypothetical protein